MSLPETIWWCSVHGSGQDYWAHIVPTCGAYKAGWSDPCVWTTLSVAGRDDLVIRREDEFWFETEGVWLNRIFYLQPGKYAIRQLESYDAAVDAALAAAEGEEE